MGFKKKSNCQEKYASPNDPNGKSLKAAAAATKSHKT